MNIEQIKSNILLDEISLKTEIIENLDNNLSSSYAPSISFSYEVHNELKTDLYGKENVENRKFNLLEIPDYVKEYSKKFVDFLFINELHKKNNINKNSMFLSNATLNSKRQSKFGYFFNTLNETLKKRKEEDEIKIRQMDDFSESYDNFKINFEKEVKDNFINNNFNLNFNENGNNHLNIDIGEIKNDFVHHEENSFHNDFDDIIQKSFDSKGNNIIEKLMSQNSHENMNSDELFNDEFSNNSENLNEDNSNNSLNKLKNNNNGYNKNKNKKKIKNKQNFENDYFDNEINDDQVFNTNQDNEEIDNDNFEQNEKLSSFENHINSKDISGYEERSNSEDNENEENSEENDSQEENEDEEDSDKEEEPNENSNDEENLIVNSSSSYQIKEMENSKKIDKENSKLFYVKKKNKVEEKKIKENKKVEKKAVVKEITVKEKISKKKKASNFNILDELKDEENGNMNNKKDKKSSKKEKNNVKGNDNLKKSTKVLHKEKERKDNNKDNKIDKKSSRKDNENILKNSKKAKKLESEEKEIKENKISRINKNKKGEAIKSTSKEKNNLKSNKKSKNLHIRDDNLSISEENESIIQNKKNLKQSIKNKNLKNEGKKNEVIEKPKKKVNEKPKKKEKENKDININTIRSKSPSKDKLKESKNNLNNKLKNEKNINKKDKEFFSPQPKSKSKNKTKKNNSDLELSNISEFVRDRLNKKNTKSSSKLNKNKIEMSNTSGSPNKNKNENKKKNTITSNNLEYKNNINKIKKSTIKNSIDNTNELDDKKISKLLEIKKQIAKNKELASFKNKKEETEINKKLSVNYQSHNSNSIKKKNSMSGIKSEIESKSESTNTQNKKYGNVVSSIHNPMSLNEEIEYIFKKIKIFKESINNNNNNVINVKDKEIVKNDTNNPKLIVKDFTDDNHFNSKEYEKLNLDLNSKASATEKLYQMKKNYIKEFLKKKSVNENKDNINFKEELKIGNNNNNLNDTFNNKQKYSTNPYKYTNQNIKDKLANDLILHGKEDYKNLIPTINSNIFKQGMQAASLNSQNRNFENLSKNKIDSLINNNNPNLQICDKKENTNILNENSNLNNNVVNYPELKVHFYKENLNKNNFDIQEKNFEKSKDFLKIPRIENNLGSDSKKNTPRTNILLKVNNENASCANKEKSNEIKNINNPKDEVKIQTFHDLIKKVKNKNKEIQFEYNDSKVSKEESTINDEKKKSIKKIASLNIVRKKDIDNFSTNILRKPSTANNQGKKDNLNLRVVSPNGTNLIKSNNINNNLSNNKKQKSDYLIKVNNDKPLKDLNENASSNNLITLKIPNVNKDSLNNMNVTNNNFINNSSNRLFNNSPNGISKNEDKSNKIVIHDKLKMIINPGPPNRNKFQQLYQNYKEQGKSSKELKVTSETDVKNFYSSIDNKVNNVKLINS